MLKNICIFIVCSMLFFVPFVNAQTKPAGSGPYPAVIEGDPGVPGHTIYRPGDLSPFNKKNPLPVLAWGNGGCANSNTFYAPFLAEVASQGFLVVAIGPYSAESFSQSGGRGGMMGGGSTKSEQLLEVLDWATAENINKNSKYCGKLNPSKFAVAGHSCGGLQALEIAADPRVSTTLAMDSGIFAGGLPKMGPPRAGAPKAGGMQMVLPNVKKEDLQKLHSPVVYIDGGKDDMAYKNGEDDFTKINKVPVAIAHLDGAGHGGTYMQPNGGEFGEVAAAWLKWQLNRDQEAMKMFAGEDCTLCKDPKWEYKKKKIP